MLFTNCPLLLQISSQLNFGNTHITFHSHAQHFYRLSTVHLNCAQTSCTHSYTHRQTHTHILCFYILPCPSSSINNAGAHCTTFLPPFCCLRQISRMVKRFCQGDDRLQTLQMTYFNSFPGQTLLTSVQVLTCVCAVPFQQHRLIEKKKEKKKHPSTYIFAKTYLNT